MPRHAHRRIRKRVRIPLYRAKHKAKKPFPAYLKAYHACTKSGKSKAYCKAHTPGYPK